MNIFTLAGSLFVSGTDYILHACANIVRGIFFLYTNFTPQALLPLERIGLWISPQQAISAIRAALRILAQ